MQEIYRTDGQLGSDVFDRGGSIAHVRGFADADDPIRQRLDEARLLARGGEVRLARALCADIVLEHQLRLHDDPELLRHAVATLIHARAFQMLSRLYAAVDGRRVRVAVTSTAQGAPSTPHLVHRSEVDGVMAFAVDESLYGDPSCDAVIDRWSEELVGVRRQTRRPVAA